MEIKPASLSDLQNIMVVIDAARKIMRANNNHTQWINGYPSTEIISNDIQKNHAYVCMLHNEIVGYFCFEKGEDPEPTYQIIENGTWLNDEPYGVIHRLASNEKAKGIAKTCFDFCFSKITNIKVDTNHNNLPVQSFLKKYGFTYCGVIYVADGSPRDAFQMMV